MYIYILNIYIICDLEKKNMFPNMGTTCAQHRPRLLPYKQALRIMPASVQHSPPWLFAENLGPIFPHHTPKVVVWPAPGRQA